MIYAYPDFFRVTYLEIAPDPYKYWLRLFMASFKTGENFLALTRDHEPGGMANRLSAIVAVDFPAVLEAFASAAVKSPSPPFGFRHAAGHEKRPSPHTKSHKGGDGLKVLGPTCL